MSYNLNIHFRLYTGERIYVCEKCGKEFYYRTNYLYHIEIKHNQVKRKALICQHSGCERHSKIAILKLMHHDKLEPECKNEKVWLLKLLIKFNESVKGLINEEKFRNLFLIK